MFWQTYNNKRVFMFPQWITRLPFCKNLSGMWYGGIVSIRRDLYDKYKQDGDVEIEGLIIHEQEHLERASKMGHLKYTWKYQTNSKFRYEEELACHAPQFKLYREKQYPFDLDNRAKILSGSLYRNPVPYEQAYKDLLDLWNKYD